MSTATINGAPPANPFLIKAAPAGATYDLCPSGNHAAVVVGIFDLGTHEEEFTNDKDKTKYTKDVRKIALFWELTGTIRPDGTPFVLGLRFNYAAKMGPKFGFRKMLEEWRGKALGDDEELDVSRLLGKSCLVNVIHTGNGQKTYHEIKSVSAPFQGMTVPKATREPILYHVSMGAPPTPEWLPYLYGQSVKDIVDECKEMTGRPPIAGKSAPRPAASAPAIGAPAAGAPGSPASDDDGIPF